jgi:hypothetical protein
MTPTQQEREARRARSQRKWSGQRAGTCATGHPALWAMSPAVEMGHIPEGGGYPVGFVEAVGRLMGVTDFGQVVHLCSGSIAGGVTIDVRTVAQPSIRADVRWLPLRPGSVRWIMADPPYGQDYAEALWGLGKLYPTPTVLLRECAVALAPGGLVALLHQVVPRLPPLLERIGTWGVSTGPGYRIRALTIARRTASVQLELGGNLR